MKFAKSILTGTGSVLLTGLVLALLVPKAAHAIAATAVQIMNTSAAPAITQDTSSQASQIVNLQCIDPQPQASFVYFSCYNVPAGQNLVITSMTVTPIKVTGSDFVTLFPSGQSSKVDVVASPTLTTQYMWAQGLVFVAGTPVDLGVSGDTNVYLTGYLTAN